jgi:DNA-binding NarL/FixJ family response regulator
MVVIPGGAPSTATTDPARARPSILVIDRQPLRSAALERLLTTAPLHARVTAVSTSDTALDIVSSSCPDVVLCDVRITPVPALEIVCAVAGRGTGAVILLGEPGDEPALLEAIDSAAAGFFTHDASVEDFTDGIRAVLDGHRAVAANLMRKLVVRGSGAADGDRRPDQALLSRTELEILIEIGQAKPVAAIAAAKGISEKTVRNHLGSIYRKLHLRGRTDAVLCAARMGLVSP